MRKNLCCLWVLLMCFAGSGFSQVVNLTVKNAALSTVLDEISKQANVSIIYKQSLLKGAASVTVSLKDVNVQQALDACLKGTSITYHFSSIDRIVIKREDAGDVKDIKDVKDLKDLKDLKDVGANEAEGIVIRGRVVNEAGEAMQYASVLVMPGELMASTGVNGAFTLSLPGSPASVSMIVSYVGKQTLIRTVSATDLNKVQVFKMINNNLKLPEVEVNGVRKATASSNSSIVFDREAIEQVQALSAANVLAYLPGQTIVKPSVSVQGLQALTMRSALQQNTIESLNNAFGVSIVIDGATVSNDANMQTMNVGRLGFFSANNISNPENSVIQDRSYRNGSLYSSYSTVSEANNGLDLRQVPVENIEKIEVISGVASARYGDYTTGLVIMDRQAGVTPWRINARVNEATQNLGFNKGMRLDHGWGNLNVGFDYLNSNDDPRNKLKAFQRVAGSLLWTYQDKKTGFFKNTIGVDANTTLDQTRLDPDLGTERMSRFNNKRVTINERAGWTLKKSWIYDIRLQGTYGIGRQESYDQYYLNGTTVKGITDAMETGIFEGYYVPGYYLAVKQIIGEPVNASGRLETNSIFKFSKRGTYRLTFGANYSYSANKGPGILIDPDRPRFSGTGNKNDRIRSYKDVPALSSYGVYMENALTTKIFGRGFDANVGVRGDWQNGFFTVSPRLSGNYKLSRRLSWNFAYGVATKSPALSQISPGNIYIDIPLINVYSGSVNESLYLAYTRVIDLQKLAIRPYRSNTFETGLSYSGRPFRVSVSLFDRRMNNGFTTETTLEPISLPNYTVTQVSGQKPTYAEDGTYKIYNVTYGKMTNGMYNHSSGVEATIATDKIRSIQTSFSFGTSYYRTYSRNNNTSVNVPDNPRYDLTAVYGVFKNSERLVESMKSTIVANTHIPALRMAVMLTGELFYLYRSKSYSSAIYPVGYYTKDMVYYSLTSEEARSADYAHLLKTETTSGAAVITTPAFVYPNVHLRLSKEIGDFLRFSFSAYNVFNIRPTEKTATGTNYYNGQPAYGAELILSIK